MQSLLLRLRGLAIAVTALALSAGLVFGAEPPEAATWGLGNAAAHAGKTVPVQAGLEDTGEDDGTEDGAADEEGTDEEGTDEEGTDEDLEEGTDEDLEEDLEETVEGAGENENCATDPTLLTDEELAELRHGSIVCWAAHQTEWPEEFRNHGAWVRSWAHWDGDEADVGEAEDEASDGDGDLDTDSARPSKDKAKGNGKGAGKGNGKGRPGGH